MGKFRTTYQLLMARLRLGRSSGPSKAFQDGVAHERRRVLWLLENMAPDRDPSQISLGATLFWAEGWNAAHDQAVALVHQRPMPQSYYDGPPDGPGWPGWPLGYDGPPESVSHIPNIATNYPLPNIGLVAPEHIPTDAEFDQATSAGDARCGYCDGPMPCYCPKPPHWGGDDDDRHQDGRITNDRTPL